MSPVPGPGLVFPIKVRCATADEALVYPGLEDAVARALSRALARARAALPAEIAGGAEAKVVPRRPWLAAGDLTPEQAERLLGLVARAVDRALGASPAPGSPGVAASAVGAPPRPSAPGAVAEPFDPVRFNPATSDYDVPSYAAGRERVPLRTRGNPFARLLELFDQAISAAEEVLHQAAALSLTEAAGPGSLPGPRDGAIRNLGIELDLLRGERRGIAIVVEVLAGRLAATSVTGADRDLADLVFDRYHKKGQPFPAPLVVDARSAQLVRGAFLARVVRIRIAAADAAAARYTRPDEAILREIFSAVGTYYLELATPLQTEAFQRLAFLDSFYRDPERPLGYAVVRFARRQLLDLWVNLQRVSPRELGLARKQPGVEPPFREPMRIKGQRTAAAAMASNRAGWIAKEVDAIGDLPRVPGAVKTVPSLEMAKLIAAQVALLQVEVAVLALWQPVEILDEEVTPRFQLWKHREWLAELNDLKNAFVEELSATTHPDLQKRVEAWQRQVQKLIDDIPPAVHRADVTAHIVAEIPYLIYGGAVAGAVGAWVGEVISGSRWVIAIAEGITLTVFNAAMTPTGLQPATLGGWSLQLATNIGFARLGRVLFEVGGDIAELLAQSRRVLAAGAVRVVLPGVTLVTIQTIGQQIEARVRGQQGESSFTELFTVNLILNVLGMLPGAAMADPAVGNPGTPEALARVTNLPEDVARQWYDLADRAAEFQRRLRDLAEQARRGTLTEEQFERWRREGITLAEDLERKLPGLARAFGASETPDQVQAAIGRLRDRLAQLRYDPRGPVTLLPELVAGLSPEGGPTWTYDPERPPSLAALRDSYGRRYRLRTLGGGFEAVDAEGRVVLQVLPAGPAVQARLLPGLDALARGPLARAGLEGVRAQSAAPQVEAQLRAAARGAGRPVLRLLQIVGRSLAAKDAKGWTGLSNWLSQGGDPATLARALTLADDPGTNARSILEQIASWDAETVRGLEALYRVRPRTTAEQLGEILGLGLDQAKGVLQSIAFLEPRSHGLGRVIGQLTVERGGAPISPFQRGALGVLNAAMRLAERFPGATFTFERRVYDPQGRLIRVQDIVVTPEEPGKLPTAYEVKEVTAAILGRRAPRQLAVDILLDWQARRAEPAAEPYATVRWIIRRFELLDRAGDRLAGRGVTDPSAAQLDAEARAMIREQLHAAFDLAGQAGVPAADLQPYRDAAERGLPFVDFY